MEAVAVNATPFLVAFADKVLRDPCPPHDFAEGFGERANILALRQRWKDKSVLYIGRGKAQQIIFKRRMNGDGDCFAGLARLVGDGLNR